MMKRKKEDVIDLISSEEEDTNQAPSLTVARRQSPRKQRKTDVEAPTPVISKTCDENLDGDEEVVLVGTANEVKLPHMRCHCTQHKFQANPRFRADIRALNHQHCDLCYCYVCDCLAKDCKLWKTDGIWHRNHCDASDKQYRWVDLRKAGQDQARKPGRARTSNRRHDICTLIESFERATQPPPRARASNPVSNNPPLHSNLSPQTLSALHGAMFPGHAIPQAAYNPMLAPNLALMLMGMGGPYIPPPGGMTPNMSNPLMPGFMHGLDAFFPPNLHSRQYGSGDHSVHSTVTNNLPPTFLGPYSALLRHPGQNSPFYNNRRPPFG